VLGAVRLVLLLTVTVASGRVVLVHAALVVLVLDRVVLVLDRVVLVVTRGAEPVTPGLAARGRLPRVVEVDLASTSVVDGEASVVRTNFTLGRWSGVVGVAVVDEGTVLARRLLTELGLDLVGAPANEAGGTKPVELGVGGSVVLGPSAV
jgi:hypothetical protein